MSAPRDRMTPLDALQATLAGEHAAIYVYGVLGGRIRRSEAPAVADALASAYTTHRARRDQVHVMVRELGAEPVSAAVAYDHGPADTTAQIVAEALGLETRCAEVYAQTVASTVTTQRQWAADALCDAAVRLLSFGGAAEPFPGLPEL